MRVPRLRYHGCKWRPSSGARELSWHVRYRDTPSPPTATGFNVTSDDLEPATAVARVGGGCREAADACRRRGRRPQGVHDGAARKKKQGSANWSGTNEANGQAARAGSAQASGGRTSRPGATGQPRHAGAAPGRASPGMSGCGDGTRRRLGTRPRVSTHSGARRGRPKKCTRRHGEECRKHAPQHDCERGYASSAPQQGGRACAPPQPARRSLRAAVAASACRGAAGKVLLRGAGTARGTAAGTPCKPGQWVPTGRGVARWGQQRGACGQPRSVG
jgi:hypothetical protein